MVLGGGELRLYVNGTPEAPVTASGSLINASRPFIIGGQVNSGSPTAYDRDIDDIRIYNRALSSNEVRRLYQSEVLPAIVGTYPALNALAVPLDSTVMVTFNTDMDKPTLNTTNIFMYGSYGNTYRPTPSYDTDILTASLLPLSPFQPGEVVFIMELPS